MKITGRLNGEIPVRLKYKENIGGNKNELSF
jgi:hypothetical protein